MAELNAALIANRYRIERKLGQGAFGQVFLAHDASLGARPVALKLLHPVYAIDPAAVQRFRREANLLAQLDHPALVPIYDAGLAGDQLFLVMRYLPGGSLAQALAEKGGLPPDRVLAMLRDLADGLDHAHAAGVIHRDLKPSNLLLDNRGHAVITDFGLARAVLGADSFTGTGTAQGTAGTTHYLAPEVLQGEPPTPASDRYGLGCVLYELLSGRPPFTGDNPMAIMFQHVQKPAPPLALTDPVGRALAEQVQRLLAKEPDPRPADLAGVVAAIDRALAAPPTLPASPPQNPTPPRPQASTPAPRPSPPNPTSPPSPCATTKACAAWKNWWPWPRRSRRNSSGTWAATRSNSGWS